MRPLITVVVGCVLALSAACSGEDPPAASPTTSAPAMPDATAPPLPDAAAEFSASGAASFVAYYVDLLEYASETGDTDDLRASSDPGCTGCFRYIDDFESRHAKGGFARNRDWTVSSSKGDFYRAQSVETTVTTQLEISAGVVQPSASDEPVDYPANSSKVSFALLFDDGWRITQFGLGDPQ